MQVIVSTYPNSSDNNSGTLTSPVRTLGRAVVLIQASNEPGEIILLPGVYREAVTLKDIPGLTIKADAPDTVYWLGTDDWTGRFAPEENYLKTAWPYKWGLGQQYEKPAPTIAPLGLRRELVKVDGQRLTQVLDKSSFGHGSFYVDETAGMLYVWPDEGTNYERTRIDVGVRGTLLKATNCDSLTLEGLHILDSATGSHQDANTGLSLWGCNNLTLKSCNLSGHGWNGLYMNSCDHVLLQDVNADDAGKSPFKGAFLRDVTMLDCTGNRANWRGVSGGFVDWDTGTKFVQVHGMTVAGFTAHDCEAPGFWLDYNMRSIALSQMDIRNCLPGLVIEKSIDGITVESSDLISNREGPILKGGLVGFAANGVTVQDCTIEDNAHSDLHIYNTEEDVFDKWNDVMVHTSWEGWGIIDTTLSPEKVVSHPQADEAVSITKRVSLSEWRQS